MFDYPFLLFLDEINCVSETLAPAMLQFLQYKIFGSGTLFLKVDDNANGVTISNVDGYCIVDAERMLIYKDSTFLTSQGVIPFLDVGSSEVTVVPQSSGDTFTKIEITRNQRVV